MRLDMQENSTVLTHVNEHGKANMVDVTDKQVT
jgi:cyclic pyranopterin phosphate synthase